MTHTRRTFLSTTAALSAVAAVSSCAAPALAVQHPDAELLTAWDNFVRAHHALDDAMARLPRGGTDADHAPYYAEIDRWRGVIETTDAVTVAGFAAQLRYYFAMKMGCLPSYRAAIYGEPVTAELTAELDEDYRDALLWRMTQAAMRAGAAPLALAA